MTTAVTIHEPTAARRSVQRKEPAPRLVTLEGAIVTVVRTMPPGSGVEAVASGLRDLGESLGTQSEDFLRTNFLADDPAERRDLGIQSDAVILVAGPTATVTELSVQYASALEAAGIPTVVVHSAVFRDTAQHAFGLVERPPACHSLDRWGTAEPTQDDLQKVFESLLHHMEPMHTNPDPTSAPAFLQGTNTTEMLERLHALGATDGLPVVLPTPEVVDAMLKGTSWHRDQVVTENFQPEGRRVTVENVAIIGSMAGAQPQQMPVLMGLASLFGDRGVAPMTKSVNSFAFAQYVGGPLASEAGLKGTLGALGPGHRGNRAVARALGLMIRNFGGAYLGVNSTPAQGNPAGPGFTFTDAGPSPSAMPAGWSPLQRDFGFKDSESSLHLFAGGFMHFGNFYYGDIDELVEALRFPDLPTGALVLVTDRFADKRADEGYSREQYQKTLSEKARRRLGELRSSGFYPLKVSMTTQGGFGAWPPHYLDLPDDVEVPIYGTEGLHVAVVGSHASLAQVWIMGRLGSIGLDQFR